jgi:hypothetical protein
MENGELRVKNEKSLRFESRALISSFIRAARKPVMR